MMEAKNITKREVNPWQNFPVPKLEVRAEITVVFNLQYLSQIFIKFNNQGVFRNPQDMQIPKLSLKFTIVQDFMEKKTNNKKQEVIMFIARQCI